MGPCEAAVPVFKAGSVVLQGTPDWLWVPRQGARPAGWTIVDRTIQACNGG